MTKDDARGSRTRIFRDVVFFQVKLGLEALLDIALIPISLAAAGLDFVFGHWRRPRIFHAVLRFGERCESWIDLWGVHDDGAQAGKAGVDSVLGSLEALVRDPKTGPETVRQLRQWAATKIAGGAPPPTLHDPDKKDPSM